jgi:hypothetical protein
MPTSLMPRFALPKQDLADLVEYLTTLKKADLASK